MAGYIAYRDTDRENDVPVSLATPLPVGFTTGGAANSLTNPIFIANAEAGDTTGTFTNATQTTNVTATNGDGYATALVSLNGTYGTASGVFEASDDSGTTWYPIGGIRSDDSAVQSIYTGLTNQSVQWSFPISGNDSFRVRSTAVASGTVNVRISISAIPTLPPAAAILTWNKTNITTGTTTLVKTGAGTLGSILIGTYVASATIKLYDGLTAVNIFSTITLPSTITGDAPTVLPLNVAFGTGLTIVTSGATDITVGWL